MAIGITNLIGHATDPQQFRSLLADLQEVCAGPPSPDIEEIRASGYANAIYGAGRNGLPEVAESLFRDLSQALGVKEGHPRPRPLAPAFSNWMAALRMSGDLDRVLDELAETANIEVRSADWLADVARHAGGIAQEVWSSGDANRRERLSRLVRDLWRDTKAWEVLRTEISERLLSSMLRESSGAASSRK